MEVSIKTFFFQQQTSGLIAEVKADNISSHKVFEGLGFSDIPSPMEGVRRFLLQFSQMKNPG